MWEFVKELSQTKVDEFNINKLGDESAKSSLARRYSEWVEEAEKEILVRGRLSSMAVHHSGGWGAYLHFCNRQHVIG
jgi:hypothetical protein